MLYCISPGQPGVAAAEGHKARAKRRFDSGCERNSIWTRPLTRMSSGNLSDSASELIGNLNWARVREVTPPHLPNFYLLVLGHCRI